MKPLGLEEAKARLDVQLGFGWNKSTSGGAHAIAAIHTTVKVILLTALEGFGHDESLLRRHHPRDCRLCIRRARVEFLFGDGERKGVL
jgi:hypothetical protein